MPQRGRTAAWGSRRVGLYISARLGHSGDSLGVGVEQQLHHIERRAAHGGVVQRQLFVLHGGDLQCTASVGRIAACGRVYAYVCVQRSYVVLYAGCIAVGVEQQLHHLQRRALRGGVVERQLSVLYIGWVGVYTWMGACGKATAKPRPRRPRAQQGWRDGALEATRAEMV